MALGSTQQKWVPGVFPGGKGGRCVRLTTLIPSCAVVMKSGNFNFLEPSGPLQACNGTAVPYIFIVILISTEHVSALCWFNVVNYHTASLPSPSWVEAACCLMARSGSEWHSASRQVVLDSCTQSHWLSSTSGVYMREWRTVLAHNNLRNLTSL
jgi:hypothetical protein